MDKDFSIDNDEPIVRTINAALEGSRENYHVQSLVNNNQIFVSFRLKQQKNLRINPATYFILFAQKDYIFCSVENPDQLFLISVTKAMNYTSSKKMSLHGKDVDSLLTMLACKAKQRVPGNGIPEEVDNTVVER